MALALSSPVWVEITDPESRNTFYANLKSVIGQRLSLHLTGGVTSGPQETTSPTSRESIERLRIVSMSDGLTSEVLNDSKSVSPIATVVSTEGPKVTPPKSVRYASSLSFLQKAAQSETPTTPLSPPTSPIGVSTTKENTSNWRLRSKTSQPTSQSGYGLSTNAFVSTFQRAASMTLNRHTSGISSQPISIPSRQRSGVTLDACLPLSTSHPPASMKFHHVHSGMMNNDAPLQPARKSFQIAERARKFGIGAPIANDEAARKMSPMIIEQQQEALRKMSVSPPPVHRRLSTRGGVSPEFTQNTQLQLNSVSPTAESAVPSGVYPSLPAELQSSISQFRIAGFAQKYFSTHKKGLFRRKVPMERMLLHQKSPLSQPLMVFNKRGVQKDALRCFKIIQKLMGERKGNGYVGPTGIELGETCVDLSIQSEDDIKLVLEMIKKGLDHGELRDEIYVQLCKQLTENPSREGSIKGWHLFTILLITFSPSKNLHDYLASFLNQHATMSLHPIPVMAQHCHDLLRRISKRGSRAKLLTLVEIARAQEAAFRPSVFEATLERLMGRQMAAGGEWAAWRVPRLMVFLKESVIELGGLKTEGIFRISGDLGAVAELRARIELGNYDITGITDPHVPCSLLRLWIRDLPEPVIPYDMYQQCIQGAQDKDAVAKVITSLPLWHKEMIIYLISFLKTFNNATVREATKMSLSNLAMVFAPTLLQCSSDDAPMLMGHLQAERAFVSTLISEVELSDEDLRIVGEATGTK
ncbi:hypothetical protein EC957_004233 [Mortierella hygrophila]|uniref:Rho-GAP domain-containing protein n=1 Tax=Mortierella hygrophila TaxID=979708 RepID=A0A9P6FFD2_9FUNG|nr:hypothetical protein EC957_004233 [Mortierella hygrophila]